MTTINEPGLYSLVLRSRKPQAKAFKRWGSEDDRPLLEQVYGELRERIEQFETGGQAQLPPAA